MNAAFMMMFILHILFMLSIPAINIDTTDFNDPELVYYSDSGYASFTSRVPLHTFTGESRHLTGLIDLQENQIDFYLDLGTLKTGIDRRDRDMYRTLNVEQHPFAEFTGTLTGGFNLNENSSQDVTASGEFTVNGVSQNVEIAGKLYKENDRLILEAEWTLLLEDYDIDPPGILFYRVDDDQHIEIRAELEPHARDEFMNQNEL